MVFIKYQYSFMSLNSRYPSVTKFLISSTECVIDEVP
jgi:hypothetical protein